MSISSDRLVALEALKAVRTTSLLVHRCQRALNDINARHALDLLWVTGHAGQRGNEIDDGFCSEFLRTRAGPGFSKRDLQKRLDRWLGNQHGALWRGVVDT